MNRCEPESPVGRPASVLIVDDTPANLQILAAMLERRGYEIRPVCNGREALLAAQTEPPDIILLDVNMPDMSGYEVCQRLKADAVLRRIPVIFISALCDELYKVKAFEFGGVDYVTKPFQTEELHARVATHLKLRSLQVDLEDANTRLAEVNERMSRDLQAAARIQETFLPTDVPRIAGASFAWAYRPCDELAGDGLNIIPLGPGLVGLYVLDVSGHGVASALLSVTLSRLLASPAEPGSILTQAAPGEGTCDVTPPAEVAGRLNCLFPFHETIEQITTMVYGVLDVHRGEFRYTSAGHTSPVYVPHGGEPTWLESDGLPIGLAEEPYEERIVKLGPADRLYLYSDGVPESMSPAGDLFGRHRLLESIAQGRALPLENSVTHILERVDRWRGTGKGQDDISILAVEMSNTSDPA